jgi:hypothetical protein
MSASASTTTDSCSDDDDEEEEKDKLPNPCRNMRILVSAHASSVSRSSSAVIASAGPTLHKKERSGNSSNRRTDGRLIMNIYSSFFDLTWRPDSTI